VLAVEEAIVLELDGALELTGARDVEEDGRDEELLPADPPSL
jgi:hypothetical protein